MVDLGVYLWYYISIETKKQINKKKGEKKNDSNGIYEKERLYVF